MLIAVRVVAAAALQDASVQNVPAKAGAAGCRVTGTVRAGSTPVPGVAIVVRVGDAVKAATSTGPDGTFTIVFGPNATYHVAAEMMAFTKIERDLTFGEAPCDTSLDLALTLTRQPEERPAPSERRFGARPGFETLDLQADINAQAIADTMPADASGDLARLLPPGFSMQSAQADAVAIRGNTTAIDVDRGAVYQRQNAIGRGEFDPATGQFAPGFGPMGGAAGDNPPGGPGGGGGGGFGGGPQGRGGPGPFVLGGRGGRGQRPYQGAVNYAFGGSALDATNLQPRNGVITPVASFPFARNTFGGTAGGPLKIPGLYEDANRRTHFQINYQGNHSTQLQDLYATVPTAAMRAGDFSGSPVQLIDPSTGRPFAGNQIPASRIDPTAMALMQYIPLPNVNGAGLTQNYHHAATMLSASNSVSLRLTQNLSPNLPQRGAGPPGGPGGRGGFPGRSGFGGAGGPGARGARPLTIMLTGQLQYRENHGDTFNVVPPLGGTASSTSLAVPIALNISKGRTNQTISFQMNHLRSSTNNPFSNAIDAAGDAGVNYPAGVTVDPVNWGVPNLTFSQFSLQSAAASERSDDRLSVGYVFMHPLLNNTHLLRLGADVRRDVSTNRINGNARGSFSFTGLYAGGGAQLSSTGGSDFADFLLGVPQDASLQVGGQSMLRQHSWDVYLEDNWRPRSRLTLNLGLRYELSMPYVEVNGYMANLDVTPNFTHAAVVTPGQRGPFTGAFPAGLIDTDWNNVGPRVGVAYRLAPNTILRGGYTITYNNLSYAPMARQLVGQPPWVETETNIGTLDDPLTIEDGLVAATATTTNNYGVDRNFGLGMIQAWNAAFSKNLPRNITVIASYTGTKGTSLSLLRAPNRNPDGTPRIPDVQAFIWESSGGHSTLQSGNVQLRRRLAQGVAAGVNYTLARSMDDASSLGAGRAVVAQNDHDLEAEWALSNFDERHRLLADVHYELPFGVGRKWLTEGGVLAAVVGEWTVDLSTTIHSGSPFTARVVNATSSVANGTSGSLRGDYSGAPLELADPALLEFFNTSAFSIPGTGEFGTASRNSISGPGGRVVNAVFTRDMRVGGSRSMGLQVNVNNLFNTIQWMSIDTALNSLTFGQVTRFAPLRTITLNLRYRF